MINIKTQDSWTLETGEILLTVVSKKDIGACITRSIAAWVIIREAQKYNRQMTYFVQPLTSIVGEQGKHSTHEESEYSLRETEASIYYNLCGV